MGYSLLGTIFGPLILGNYHIGIWVSILRLHRDNGKENGNYYNRVT